MLQISPRVSVSANICHRGASQFSSVQLVGIASIKDLLSITLNLMTDRQTRMEQPETNLNELLTVHKNDLSIPPLADLQWHSLSHLYVTQEEQPPPVQESSTIIPIHSLREERTCRASLFHSLTAICSVIVIFIPSLH